MNCEKCACALRVAGRALFALPMIFFGVMHFMAADQMVGSVPAYMPAPSFWVYFTGVALVLAGVAILVNRFASWAGALLGLMLLVFVVMLYLPAVMGGDQVIMGMMLKDVVMAGGAFYIAGTSCNKACSKEGKC